MTVAVVEEMTAVVDTEASKSSLLGLLLVKALKFSPPLFFKKISNFILQLTLVMNHKNS